MITAIVESTIGYYYVCRTVIFICFFSLCLLRTNHYERQLSCWLPYLIFLSYLLSVCWQISGSLIAAALGCFSMLIFWILSMIYFVARILCSSLFFFSFMHSSTSHNIKSCLCFGNYLSILMFFETNIFLFELLLSRLIGLIYRFRM